MATIIPNSLGNVSKPVAQMYRLAKKFPKYFTIWFALDKSQPHCLILLRDLYLFVVQIAATPQELAETAVQKNLFDSRSITPDELGGSERRVLDDFTTGLGEEIPSDALIRKLVVFPDVTNDTIQQVTLQRTRDTGVRYLGIREMSADRFAYALEELAADAAPAPAILSLRRAFTPESVVPREFSALRTRTRNTTATLESSLLDIDQEWCTKNDIYLSDDGKEALDSAENNMQRSQLVTGVAGSGKSLVLLYRAMLQAQVTPDARVLVLTHNRPLNHELKSRFGRLAEPTQNLEWRTFFSWAQSNLTRAYPETRQTRAISPGEIARIIEELIYKARNDGAFGSKLSAAFVTDEIGWIKDHAILHADDYLEARRTGRKSALGKVQRSEIWRIFSQYQHRLQERQLTDWHNIAMRFSKCAVAGEFAFPRYDCILIDEAQFFAKAWFDAVNAALNPGGQLFLAADPTQGFLRRRQSWLASGIDVRGRTTRLKASYRNSRKILEFATAFYASRDELPDDTEELNIPTQEALHAIEFQGEAPSIVHCGSIQDTHQRVTNELVELRRGDSGLENGNVLVLHADSSKVSALVDQLGKRLGPGAVHNAKEAPPVERPFCLISTLNAATGLEAPIVFLLGIDQLLDPEDSPSLSEDERLDLRSDNTRQLYMAFTRAGQRLIILTTSKKRALVLEGLVR